MTAIKTPLAEELGIEVPIFAFTRDPAVVAAVSRAGGMGVLGAVGSTLESLRRDLDTVVELADGKPFGLDVVMPAKLGDGSFNVEHVNREALEQMIPFEQYVFVENLLRKFNVPDLPESVTQHDTLLAWTEATTRPQVDLGLEYPIKLLANALGAPPPDIVRQAHDKGVLVAALTGSVRHAEHHIDNDVDMLIAQGTEAGGHCGEISTMVLVPEIVDAAPDRFVVAAGGIGDGRQVAASLALGAQGAWTGSIWLLAAESSTPNSVREKLIRATSRDTVRSRAWTGKPCRQLKSPWQEAWDAPESPKTMGVPFHWMVTGNAMQRMYHYIDDTNTGAAELIGQPVGQIVGRMNQVRPAEQIMDHLIADCKAALKRLAALA